jgi:transcriptional regulator with XRE-family HTH domain
MIDPDKFYRVVGERIRTARLHKGWNQQRLALNLGMTRTSVTNMEAGRQHLLLVTAYVLADALGVPMKSLLP